MKLSFNSQNNLHQTVKLTSKEFHQHFGANPERRQQIANALPIFRIFYRFGCTKVYIGGSFVSKKKYPEDIDICFDVTLVDIEKLKREFPQFFDPNEIGKIHKTLKCHIFYFTKEHKRLLHLLEEDRDGNPKGLVGLSLKDILTHYDQK
jgi:hypothetical protein